jgi:hypothetical protein
MLEPNILAITENEFISLVNTHEQNWIEERKKTPIRQRDSCVQFWVRINRCFVLPQYIDNLRKEYKKQGWSEVQIEWIEDRTESLMIRLKP